MSHTIALPVSRYGLAGFLSLMLTLLMFLALFETIKAPNGTIIVVDTLNPPPAFTILDKPKPREIPEITKPEFKPTGQVAVILPPTITTTTTNHEVVRPERPIVEIGTGTGESPSSLLEGEIITVVKVPPIYPISAEARGIEGYVVVEYNVTAYGTASDIRIIEASPEKIFDRSSIDAVANFKFKPRVVNGTPVETRGLRNKFTFQLNN